ncbi:helix-turn-helix domain-containing protein [Phenylobacterium sp.]|uniref:helix-turn-helix domain-containing protein n=1 Tax=Phenylobacterium sp. TaxID=1871053 RepID=UPI002FC7E575
MPKSTFTDAYARMLQMLVALRKDAGVTQVELSQRLGKPQPFVSNFERGRRRIDVIEFYAITKALGADPQQIFGQLADQLPDIVAI